ncbi:MAG: HNH endonuclease, partial [Candidatus Omnitrophica bacterium]|nr:HNH endonuclease [Candidatus Omnitrophota bacterium]
YRYDPKTEHKKELEGFTREQKEAILRRDNYKCVVCGRGELDGVELHVDHIKPRYLGGKSTIENGQTLCAQHNLMKKKLKQTETGKKMFIRLYEFAKAEGMENLKRFCVDVLKTYEKYNINDHIKWEE